MKVKSESEVAQSCWAQRPHGLQPTRLLCPWDFPGTGVGCHCLLWLAPHSSSKSVGILSRYFKTLRSKITRSTKIITVKN